MFDWVLNTSLALHKIQYKIELESAMCFSFLQIFLWIFHYTFCNFSTIVQFYTFLCVFKKLVVIFLMEMWQTPDNIFCKYFCFLIDWTVLKQIDSFYLKCYSRLFKYLVHSNLSFFGATWVILIEYFLF